MVAPRLLALNRPPGLVERVPSHFFEIVAADYAGEGVLDGAAFIVPTNKEYRASIFATGFPVKP